MLKHTARHFGHRLRRNAMNTRCFSNNAAGVRSAGIGSIVAGVFGAGMLGMIELQFLYIVGRLDKLDALCDKVSRIEGALESHGYMPKSEGDTKKRDAKGWFSWSK